MTRDTIVILSRSLPHHGLGGMEVVAWDLATEFARQGLSVTVLTTPIPGLQGEFVQNGVRVVPLDGMPSGRYSTAWWKVSRSYFEQHLMQSVCAVLSVSAAAFGLLPLKHKIANVPFIMQAHGTSWGEVVSKWRSRRLKSIASSIRNVLWLPKDLMAYRRFDIVVAVGEQVYQDLNSKPISYVLEPGKVKLIPNGIDTSLFQPSVENRIKIRKQLGISEESPVIISASRLHPQKGVGHGLRAFAELLKTKPSAVYLIAGDGPDSERLQMLSYELNISNNVYFLGALDRYMLVEYLQAADVFLFLTDRVEVGLSLNVLEALATGLPVVLSKHICFYTSRNINSVMQNNIDSVIKGITSILEEKNNSLNYHFFDSENSLFNSVKKYILLLGGK